MMLFGGQSTFCRVVTASRDLTLASGSQTVTGAGFTPRAIDVMGLLAGTQITSDGWCDSTLTQCTRFTGMNAAAGSAFIVYSTGASVGGFYTDATLVNNQIVVVSALTDDGCTLAWTKTGSPTGVVTLYIRFWR